MQETGRYVAACDEIVSWFDANKEKISSDIEQRKQERKEVHLYYTMF